MLDTIGCCFILGCLGARIHVVQQCVFLHYMYSWCIIVRVLRTLWAYDHRIGA